MHKSVVGSPKAVEHNTARTLAVQEQELVRAFKTELQNVSKDLEAQRHRKGEHSTELQEQLRTREDDRQDLLTRLVQARKEAQRLKESLKDIRGEQDRSLSQATSQKGSDTARSSVLSHRSVDPARLTESRSHALEREASYRERLQRAQ